MQLTQDFSEVLVNSKWQMNEIQDGVSLVQSNNHMIHRGDGLDSLKIEGIAVNILP